MKSVGGRPTKRSPAVEKRLLEVVKTGLPLKFASASVGISYHTLVEWRNRDPRFAEAVEIARLASVEERWLKIQQAAEDTEKLRGDWKALAWCLERSHPESFARPEIQLGIAIQNNVGGNGNHNFETVVVSDLEFLGLRKHENYSHRPHEKPARDVESTVMSNVPNDLSGVLEVVNHPGSAVVSESQAAESRRRVERANAAIDALLAAKHAGNGNGAGSQGSDSPSPVNALVLAPIAMPQGEPTQSWWAAISYGDNSRQIQREAAIYVCRTILFEVLGAVTEQNTSIDFESELAELRDVHTAIQDLCGPRGWGALLKKANRDE